MPSWRDRLADLGRGAAESGLRAVRAAVEQLPDEIVQFEFGRAGIAKIIVLADERGFLNDPHADGLRDIAHRESAGEKVSIDELIDVLPEVSRLGLIQRIYPDPETAARITSMIDKGVSAYRLSRMFGPGIGGVLGGKTTPSAPAPQAGAPEADTPASQPESPSDEPPAGGRPNRSRSTGGTSRKRGPGGTQRSRGQGGDGPAAPGDGGLG